MKARAASQEVQRPLGLSERMLCLAAAISIDYDYFSRHSSGAGGGFLGPFLFPMPMPPYPSEGNQGSPEGAEAPAEGAGASPEGAQGPTGAAEESPFPPEDDSFPSGAQVCTPMPSCMHCKGTACSPACSELC